MKDLIKDIANTHNIPEYLVRSVVNHYFKEIKKTLHHPEYKKIELGRLGSFTIDRYQLNVKIVKQFDKLLKSIIKYNDDIVEEEKENFRKYWNLRNYLNNNYGSKPFKKSNLSHSTWYRIYKSREWSNITNRREKTISN